MTHSINAVLVAIPVAILCVTSGVYGFRLSATAPADDDAREGVEK